MLNKVDWAIRDYRRMLIAVFLVAAFVYGMFFVMRGRFEVEPSDQREYYKLAVSLYEGHGFYDGYWWAHRPPLYSHLMAGLFHIVGSADRDAVLFCQTLLGIATSLLIAWLGDRMFDPFTGLLAGLGMALYPVFPWYSTFILYESLYVFLMTALLCLLWLWRQSLRWVWAVGVGVVLGLMLLTHGKTLLLLPFAVGYMALIVWTQRRTAFAQIGLVLGLVIIAILPWAYRNYQKFSQFVPINTSGGLIIYQAYNPYDQALLDRSQPELKQQLAQRAEPAGDEVAMSKLGYSLAVDWIRAHPLRTAELLIRKAFLFLSPHIEIHPVLGVLYGFLSMFAAWGALLLWRQGVFQRYELALLAVPIMGTAASNILFLVFYRYRIPMLNVLVLLAAFAFAQGLTPFLAGQLKRL